MLLKYLDELNILNCFNILEILTTSTKEDILELSYIAYEFPMFTFWNPISMCYSISKKKISVYIYGSMESTLARFPHALHFEQWNPFTFIN